MKNVINWFKQYIFFKGLINNVRIQDDKMILTLISPPGKEVTLAPDEIKNFFIDETQNVIYPLSLKTYKGTFYLRGKQLPSDFTRTFSRYLAIKKINEIKKKSFKFITIYLSISLPLTSFLFIGKRNLIWIGQLSLFCSIVMLVYGIKEIQKFKKFINISSQN